MSSLSEPLRNTIVARHHTVTLEELLADGIEARDIERWLGTRVLTRMSPGVFALSDALGHTPFETRAAAAFLADDLIALDPLSSARHWQFTNVFHPSRPSFVDTTGLADHSTVERPGGIRVLSPAATWFGLAGELRPDTFAAVSMSVLGVDVAITDAHRMVRTDTSPGRVAHRRAAAVLASRRRWQRPRDPQLERRVRASLRRRGHTGLDGTHELLLADGFTRHLTAADPIARWGIEIDHRRWHGGRWSPALAARIDQYVAAQGWRVLTVTDHRLRHNFNATMEAIAADHESARHHHAA